MIKQEQILEESIANKIADYQRHLNNWKFDEQHVDTWIKQFPEDERLIVLTETDSILKHNYINIKKIWDFFGEIWSSEEIIGSEPETFIEKIQFLNIQSKGSSQKRLVGLIENYYLSEKNVRINKKNYNNVKKYIYLDDCMFTGYTILKDISKWITTMDPNEDTELCIVLLGMYNGNQVYIENKLEQLCSIKNICVKIYRLNEYNNDIDYYPYDFLWSQYIDDEYVNAYIEEMEQEKCKTGKGGLGFRKDNPINPESELFTCSYNRNIFEKSLMKKGAYICSLPQNRNDRMKPMGYSHGISLGFGAFFATCYNISNNCPLAFWWGDLFSSPTETLGKWYPLLPRGVN